METKFLLEGESILTKSNDNSVVLTSHRLVKNIKSYGHAYFMSVQLEKISTVEIRSKSHPLLLVFGVVCAITGPVASIQLGADNLLIVGLVLGVILILLYFLTRYHLISVASDGGAKIHILTKGAKREALLDFVKKIDQAKDLVK